MGAAHIYNYAPQAHGSLAAMKTSICSKSKIGLGDNFYAIY